MDTTPEVSEILAELPWWASRGLLFLILGLTILGITWAGYSRLDMVVEARGRLIPEGDVRQVQAANSGLVQFVRVKEGDTVARGQLMIQLDTAELHSKISRLNDELATAEEQLRQLRSGRGPVAETLDRQNRIQQLKSDISGVEEAIRRSTITAPVAGTITRLDVRNPHTVVQAGQALLAIAPANSRLFVEVQVPNKDVALIEKGLPAKIKFDAFPFQDYGIVNGEVVEISPDSRFDERLGSFYRVTVLISQKSFTAHGKEIPLRAGLASSVEIITEKRSVLSLLLEPFRKLKGEAGQLR